MRNAKVADHWRTVQKRKYNTWISSLNMQGLLGFGEIQFDSGVFAVCGLNGAGKSTVISSIKDALGIQLTIQDIKRVGTHKVNVKLSNNDIEINCSNEAGLRASDTGIDIDLTEFVDYSKSTQAIEYFLSQENFDELIEQNEMQDLSKVDITELSYIVGKAYQKCALVEINDVVIGETDLGTIPFFKVQCDGVEYDSTTMGVGEHFAFYIYWTLKTIPENSILIIEEPETFISIASQENLMNYIASVVAKKGISVIISTHSPFILGNVPAENTCILSRFAGISQVIKPDKTISTFSLLGSRSRKDGVIFVEDFVAKLFLSVLLEDRAPDVLRAYNIEDVGGDGEISKRLCFPSLKENDYRFIGVYDGDIKVEITGRKNDFCWPYLFLPLTSAPEEEFRKILSAPETIQLFCEMAGIDLGSFVSLMSKLAGEDGHDWFLDMCREIGREHKLVVWIFYRIWLSSNEENICAFLKSLNIAINEMDE
jgi:predicted ATPase